MPEGRRRPGKSRAGGDAFAEAMKLFAAGRFAPALALLEPLAKRAPRDPRLLLWTARCESRLGRLARARQRLDRLQRLRPRDPDVFFEQAEVLKQEGRVEEALDQTERGLAVAPDHLPLVCEKAHLLRLDGAAEEAWHHLREHADADDPHPQVILQYAQVARRFEDAGVLATRLRSALERPADLPDDARAALLHELARLLAAREDYDGAFAAATEANAFFADAFDPEAFDRDVDHLIASWSPATYRGLPASGLDTDRPIFVLGMPRSGTTLIETVLARHDRVEPAGETLALPARLPALIGGTGGHVAQNALVWPWTCETLREAGTSYLAALDAAVGTAAPRVTDKLVYNFFRVGVIHRMFPAAPIVHCTRDPLDTCISCFFEPFLRRAPFTSALGHLGRYYRGYQRVMRHWTDTLGIPVIEVEYERFVSAQEAETRRLLAEVGLDWDERCLSFHEGERTTVTFSADQVRQKLYSTSVGRHRVYDRHLAPLREALANDG